MKLSILIAALLLSTAFGYMLTVSPSDNIQSALESLSPGDTLFLSSGVYTSLLEQPLLHAGPAQQGITIMSDPLDRAVLQGNDIERPVMLIEGPMDSTVRILNLEVTGGNAMGEPAFSGGGISCSEARVLISNCLVHHNTALMGGGAGASGGELSVHWSVFSNNTALVTGGGIDAYACSVNGFSTVFTENSSSDDGGGFNGYQSNVEMTCCLFHENESGDDGGGICILQGTSVLSWLTLHGNSTFDDGGALRIHTIDSMLVHSTIISGNTGKGGVSVISPVKPVFMNSCAWNNEISNYRGMDDPTGTMGNISEDPIYADSVFSLSHTAAGQTADSPCIDQGLLQTLESPVKEMSTRTDSLPDTGISDMGYHHASTLLTGMEEEGARNAPRIQAVSPASGAVTIVFSGVPGGNASLYLHDITGRLVLERSLGVGSSGSGSCVVDVSGAPGGLLFLRLIHSRGGAVTGTVVIK